MVKMKKCETCGADMAITAKICPSCGAKNKRPIYTKWWFWVIIAVVVLSIGAASTNSGEKTENNEVKTTVAEEKAVEYTAYDVTELFDALKENPAKAQKTFKGQYVELTGYLDVIDSDGSYFSLGANPGDYSYIFQSIHCKIKNDDQLNLIMELKKGDSMIVRGEITDVGEILGYTLTIDSIN